MLKTLDFCNERIVKSGKGVNGLFVCLFVSLALQPCGCNFHSPVAAGANLGLGRLGSCLGR